MSFQQVIVASALWGVVSSNPTNNTPAPTLVIPCVFGLVSPCGNVSLPANFSTPFGTVFAPGKQALGKEAGGADKAFQQYTVYFVAGIVGLCVLLTVMLPGQRRTYIKKMKKMFAGGHPRDADPDETEEEKQQLEKDQHDPTSEHFIAPCQIYRFMAVMHPGIIGYSAWFNMAFQALVCAYMQLFLPLSIFLSTLEQWEFYGVKSPFWWIMNLASFASRIAALASICNLFVGKCSEQIKTAAEAAFFLVTHDEPEPAAKDDASGAEGTAPKELEEPLLSGGVPAVPAVPKIPAVPVPMWIIELNEKLWVISALLVEIFMSFGLVACFFVKVATFTGDMADIAIVTVSLYFVSDLDNKVLEASPQLKKQYGRMVLKQTVRNETNPVWIYKLVNVSCHFLEMSVSVGIAFICLFAWKGFDKLGHTVIIGGDPFGTIKAI